MLFLRELLESGRMPPLCIFTKTTTKKRLQERLMIILSPFYVGLMFLVALLHSAKPQKSI